jgi:Ni,Fe-hydrogenase maturation factor
MTPGERDIVIVGCGRWLRGDDQAGLLAAEALVSAKLPHARVYASESPAADIALLAADARLLIVVDAARAGGRMTPGTWRKYDYAQVRGRLREATVAAVAAAQVDESASGGAVAAVASGHSISVGAALELAARLGCLPREVWVYVIAVERVAYGGEVSPEAARAVREVTTAIRTDVVVWHRMHAELSHA